MSNNVSTDERLLDLEHIYSELVVDSKRWEDLYKHCSDREANYRARMCKYEWIQNILEYFGDFPWKSFPRRTNTNSK